MKTRAFAAACCSAVAILGFAGSAGARLVTSAPAGTGWGDTATSLRGQNGAEFVYVCPSGGSFGTIWGTDVYTDDSSVCTAAVHTGRITPDSGGIVTIRIQPGQSAYTGSARNGVTSGIYGNWPGSFVLTGASAGGSGGVKIGQAGWGTNATAFRGQNGTRFMYVCLAGGTAGRVWGTNTYTDDSSVCTAAVHVGLISLANGGMVTIEIRPGASAYAGVTHNGVTTSSYGSFAGSFVFPAAKAIGTSTGTATVATGGHTWNATATGHRGQIGKLIRYSCPSRGQALSVWGSSTYTDDSSVCTAAVHAGLITFTGGGSVTIAMRPGRASYASSTRHGVTTHSYGRWPGSFVFVVS